MDLTDEDRQLLRKIYESEAYAGSAVGMGEISDRVVQATECFPTNEVRGLALIMTASALLAKADDLLGEERATFFLEVARAGQRRQDGPLQ